MAWKVYKFGGTSVADARSIRQVVQVARNCSSRCAVVVSALAKVTDGLALVLEQASQQDERWEEGLESLRARHVEVIGALKKASVRSELEATLTKDFEDLRMILKGIWVARSASQEIFEVVTGFGELWSARIVQAFVIEAGTKCAFLDARDVLVVENGATGVEVIWKESGARCSKWIRKHAEPIVVVTGYIASSTEGRPTTLGRNGSDYSAAIFGALLRADEVTIWKEVDGVLSADPRRVNETVLIHEMSYHEAMELAFFGGKVIHPKALIPAIEHEIPVRIRNTFKPSDPGTLIHKDAHASGVKGFSAIEQMALMNVEGAGMIGVPGIASRVFRSLRDVGVSVVLISQASSEHSICFAVSMKQAKLAVRTVREEFSGELKTGRIQSVEMQGPCSVVAIVGDGMAHVPGTAAKFFDSLGKAHVNIRAIAQGASERNISVVIDEEETTRALQAAHSAFYLSDLTLSLGVIGPGLIGSTLLRQLEEQSASLRKTMGLDLRVRGIMNSSKMMLEKVRVGQWDPSRGVRTNVEKFVEHVSGGGFPHSVIVDCTSNDDMASLYSQWLSQGIHVVTPNKKANSGPLKRYQEIRAAARGSFYLDQTTVGAGLPLLSTLRDLMRTGDEIIEISALVSGTLSFIFNSFNGQNKFSEVLLQARAKGYTEPDPRDDLSGSDVARKIVTLAREGRLEISMEDLKIQDLVPEKLRKLKTSEEFLARAAEMDGEMEKLRKRAADAGEVLRYVGTVNARGKGSVGLRKFALTHPMAHVSGTDNLVMFRTRRYDQQPLIVQGPGAGPEVTAGGVLADLVRLGVLLGAKKGV